MPGPRRRQSTCHPDRPHYGHGLCNACWQRQWRAANPEKAAASRRRWLDRYPEKAQAYERKRGLLRNYGISVEEYDALLAKQGGVCAICRGKNIDNRMLAVDHDHKTGEVRGLLCNLCNRGVGAMRDDPELLLKAAVYLGLKPSDL